MGLDDDQDCVEHVFALGEVHVTGQGDAALTCQRCGALAVEPGTGQAAALRNDIGAGDGTYESRHPDDFRR